MSPIRLGVMALYLNGDDLLEEREFFRMLTIYGKPMDIRVMVFTPDDVNSEKKRIYAHLYDTEKEHWYRVWVPYPDLIYDRCRLQKSPRFERLRKFRATHSHLHFMNRPMSHKWTVHQLLYKDKDVREHLPETLSYKSHADLERFLSSYSLVYLKPADGTGGRGILRIERLGGGVYLIQGRDRSRRIINPERVPKQNLAARLSRWGLQNGLGYLIQQGIHIKLQDGRVHDYRLLIQKNGSGEWEVTGCAGRIGPKRSITSNLHGGGMAVPMRKLLGYRFESEDRITAISDTMNELAHKVVRVLERQYGRLCEMALDIAVDNQGRVWLLECNPKPAREVFRRIREAAVYKTAIVRPLEYAQFLYGNRTEGNKSRSDT